MHTALFLLALLLSTVTNVRGDDGMKAKLRKELNQKFDALSDGAQAVGAKINAILDKNLTKDEMEKEFEDLTKDVPEKVKQELVSAHPTMNGKEITVDQFFDILEIH